MNSGKSTLIRLPVTFSQIVLYPLVCLLDTKDALSMLYNLESQSPIYGQARAQTIA